MKNSSKYYFLLSAAAATLLTACSAVGKNSDAAVKTPEKTPAAAPAQTPAAAPAPAQITLKSSFEKSDIDRARQVKAVTPQQQKYDVEFNKKANAARLAYQKTGSEADAKAWLAFADDPKASDAARSSIYYTKAVIDMNKKPEVARASIQAALKFQPSPASKDRAQLYQLLANLEERQKNPVAAAEARLARLSEDIPNNKPAEIYREKTSIIQMFSRAKQRSAAFALAKELAADETLDKDQKRSALKLRVDVGGTDPEMLKENIAFLMTKVSDPDTVPAFNTLFMYMRQAKMTRELSELSDKILNDEKAVMPLRITWFKEKGNAIRNNQWSNKRRFFYLLGNTLLRNDKRNPFCGKELIADAVAEIKARQNEDLNWITPALKELKSKMEPKDYADLLNYVRQSASLVGDTMVRELAQMVTEINDIPDNMKVNAFSTLIKMEINRGDFNAAMQVADRAEKLNITMADEGNYAAIHSFKARIMMMQKDSPDEAAAYIQKQIDSGAKNRRMYDQLANIYRTFYRWDDEIRVRQAQGDRGVVLRLVSARDPEKARAMALNYIETLKNDPKELGFRASCMNFFMPQTYGLRGCSESDRAVRAKYPELVKELGRWHAGAYIAGARRAITYENYPMVLEMTGLWKARDPKASYERSSMEVQSYAALGDRKGLQAVIKEISEAKEFNAYQKTILTFSAGAALLADQKGELTKYYQNFKFPAEITEKQRSEILIQAGVIAMNGKLYTVAQEAYDVRQTLYKPEPKKLYTVKFSDQQIVGLEGFKLHAGNAEKQKLDRKFGGNMDFLTTDVSTGGRAGGIGSDKSSAMQFPEFQAACDENGIHLVFTVNDDKTKEILAGTVGAGSFEMYFAPGEDQPYFTFLPDLTTGGITVWDSIYRNKQWRRLTFNQKEQNMRMERIFTEKGYVMYMFLSWEPFYDKLPEAGDKWDFENVYWSRFGGYSWNGIRTIHGRSTWGKLTFRISPEQMLKIKQKIIYAAKRKYQAEKVINPDIHGAIPRWSKDAVLGDPKFYAEKVAPVVAKLDSKLGDVKADMTPETINDLYRNCVPGWFEIRYVIGDLRRQYLEENLSKE